MSPLDDRLVKDYRIRAVARDTEELARIYRENDRALYPAEVLQAVRLVLTDRGVLLPPQRRFIGLPRLSRKDRLLKAIHWLTLTVAIIAAMFIWNTVDPLDGIYVIFVAVSVYPAIVLVLSATRRWWTTTAVILLGFVVCGYLFIDATRSVMGGSCTVAYIPAFFSSLAMLPLALVVHTLSVVIMKGHVSQGPVADWLADMD